MLIFTIYGILSNIWIVASFSNNPLIYHILELLLDGYEPAFKLFWIFVMPIFLKILWSAVCWWKNTKIGMLLVNKCFSYNLSSNVISLNFSFMQLREAVLYDVSVLLSYQNWCFCWYIHNDVFLLGSFIFLK